MSFRSTNNGCQSQSDNLEDVAVNAYESTRKDSVYSTIEHYDCIAEMNEGYAELTLVVTNKQETPADVVPLQLEELTTSTDAPEPPPPRQHEYLILIS